MTQYCSQIQDQSGKFLNILLMFSIRFRGISYVLAGLFFQNVISVNGAKCLHKFRSFQFFSVMFEVTRR